MGVNTFDGDVVVTGEMVMQGAATLPASSVTNATVSATAAIVRSKLAQEALAQFPVDLTSLRVWDDLNSALPTTSAADDLGILGTFATGAITVETSDLKAAGSTTRYARFMVGLPAEYDDGQTIQIRVRGGMITTVADTAATIDVEAYKFDGAGGIGSDLCTTAAQSHNSLTFADLDFTINESGFVSGDLLDVRVTMLVNDTATGTEVKGRIANIALLCDVRG